MDYLEFALTVSPADPGLEIAQAALSTLPFDTFTTVCCEPISRRRVFRRKISTDFSSGT